MAIDPDVLAVVVLANAVLTLGLLTALGLVVRRLRTVRRTQRRVFDGGQRDVVELLDVHATDLSALWGELGEVRTEVATAREQLGAAVSRIAVVRYDAFEDMGGALSFSAALLDEHGHGVVLSAINGRAETRCYSKSVTAGESEHSLTAEEVEAVEAALTGRRVELRSAGGRGRRRRRAS